MAEIYTAAELEEQIRAIDEQIKAINARPAQSTLDGNFVSWAGSISSLMQQRRELMRRLELVRARAAGASGLQGPRRII